MVEITANDNVVVGPYFDDLRQVVLPGDGGDVELIEIVARRAFEFVALAEKIVDRLSFPATLTACGG